MRSSARLWLVVELLVCFAPCTLMLLLGAGLLPMQVIWLFQEPLNWEGPAWVILAVACGIVGLCTLLFVVSQLFRSRERIERPVPVLAGVLLGTAPLLMQAVLALSVAGDVEAGLLTFTVLLPLLATAHILFLSRKLFVAGFRSGRRPLIGRGTWIGIALVVLLATLLISLRQGIGSTALEERRAYWLEHKPATYTYQSSVSGWFKPVGATYPKKIWVTGSAVTAASYTFAPFHDSTMKLPPVMDGALTIDQIFDAMIDAKRQGARVQARFDRSTGAVLHVRVYNVAEDADWGFEVKEFREIDAATLAAESHAAQVHSLQEAIRKNVVGKATGTVLVAIRGRVLLIEPIASEAQLDHKPSGSTTYDLASIGKTFTAVLALHLVDQNRFDLDKPLRQHLPELPKSMSDMTSRSALSHTAGLPRYFDGDDLVPRDSRKALLEIAAMKRERAAGQYYYSNVGPTLVALAIERTMGEPFAQLLRTRIFEPLQMSDAYLHGDSRLAEANVAPAYADGKRQGSPSEWPQTWTMLGAGGIAGSVEDLLHFNRGVFVGQFLSAKSKTDLLADGFSTGGRASFKNEDTLDIHYGNGLFHWRDRQGRRVHFHGGASDFGSNTGMLWREDDDVFIAVLLNSTTDKFDRAQFYSEVLGAIDDARWDAGSPNGW